MQKQTGYHTNNNKNFSQIKIIIIIIIIMKQPCFHININSMMNANQIVL
jgi:hypothetical protein